MAIDEGNSSKLYNCRLFDPKLSISRDENGENLTLEGVDENGIFHHFDFRSEFVEEITIKFEESSLIQKGVGSSKDSIFHFAIPLDSEKVKKIRSNVPDEE